MKQRLTAFGVLHFVIMLLFLTRQLYYFNLISSFVVSGSIVIGLLFLVFASIVTAFAILLLYYIPSLIVIELSLHIKCTHIILPTLQQVNDIGTQYIPNKKTTFQRLQVMRC